VLPFGSNSVLVVFHVLRSMLDQDCPHFAFFLTVCVAGR
jgi:hypothetical protein